ncbi:MAG: hypothetical protein EOO92_17000 [Pedobacter sp.]|nr:MAG: hypothetical protein EOO92_17000 [Pedobacter sp.]
MKGLINKSEYREIEVDRFTTGIKRPFQDVVTVSGGVETRIKYAGYRQLFLAYIPDLSNPLISLVNIPVATSDIQTNTGVIHVLNRPKHNFGFNTDRFIEEVIAAGIKPASP